MFAASRRLMTRVLSIQSHVVHGYVGNKSAVFPLQVNGIEVDIINSVQFSNHTGYPSWKGQALDGDQLWSLIEGLETNNLLKGYTHLLTGYIGSTSFLRTIVRVVEKLRQYNPELIYVCDPVLGDDGKLYVKEELVPVYQNEVLPLASVLTPNQFECEVLTGKKIHNVHDAKHACELLHEKGIPVVVITSAEYGRHGELNLFCSRRHPCKTSSGSIQDQYCASVPKIPSAFTGTGDLFASLLLGHLHLSGGDLKSAVEKTLASVQAVLQRTSNAGSHELLLIASKADLENPTVTHFAEPFSSERID